MATSKNSGGLGGWWKSVTGRSQQGPAVAAANPSGADGVTKPLKRSKAKPENAEVQPSARIYRTWTPSLLKNVQAQADSGSMGPLADLCDQILADDRVAKAYDAVVGGLLSLDLTFEPAGDGRRRNRPAKALGLDEDWWRANPENELQQFVSQARCAGLAFAQLVWEPWNRRVIPRLEPWYLGHFRYDTRTHKWYVRDENGVETEVTPGDGRWVLFTPFGAYRPWARGQWRGLSRLWLLKQYAISDSGRLGEKNGALVATPKQDFDGGDEQTGSIKDSRRKLAADLASLAAEGVVVLPNGFELDLLTVQANTDSVYKTQWEFANTSIDITLQGQNLTSEVKEGSRAAADVHGRVESRIIRNVGVTTATVLHDQQVSYWAAFNYGDPDLAPWPTWDTDVPEDTKSSAEGQKAFGEALTAVQTAGYEIDNVDELADKYGLKLKKKEAPKPGDPGAAPVPPKGDDDPDDDDDKPENRARRSFVGALKTALASGAKLAGNKGFVDGQLYVDAVVDYASDSGDEALKSDTLRIREAIDAATDAEDLRARLKALFAELSPEELSDRAYKAMLMAELAGIRSVTQDA